LNATEALARLQRLGVPVLTTGEAAAALRVTGGAAHKTLLRLAGAGLIARVTRGIWAVSLPIDPMLLPEHLTAPFPAYVSLQTALWHHGLIEQIPAAVFAVSLGRTRRLRTAMGSFSIHRVAPEVFGGFETRPSGVKIATPEKALFDLLYLSATRARIFAALPEIELPRRFDRRAARAWIARITSPALAAMVQRKWSDLVG
jgi:predicted transcriptional regulator of viral defense system